MFFWFLILIHRCSLHWGKFGLNAFLAKWVPSRSYSTGSSPSWNRWFVHPRRRTTSHDWECFLETTVYIFFVIKLQVGNKKHLATKDLEYFWQMEQNLGTRWFKNHPILSETQLHVVALAVIWYQTCTAKNMGITMSNPSHIYQASTTDLRGCIPYRLYGDGASCHTRHDPIFASKLHSRTSAQRKFCLALIVTITITTAPITITNTKSQE